MVYMLILPLVWAVGPTIILLFWGDACEVKLMACLAFRISSWAFDVGESAFRLHNGLSHHFSFPLLQIASSIILLHHFAAYGCVWIVQLTLTSYSHA